MIPVESGGLNITHYDHKKAFGVKKSAYWPRIHKGRAFYLKAFAVE